MDICFAFSIVVLECCKVFDKFLVYISGIWCFKKE